MAAAEAPDQLTPFQKWRYALKIKSWPKILVPFVLGHAIGGHYAGEVHWRMFLLSSLAVFFGVGFIVLMNDWGDRRIDALKRQMFPDGCSPKTIADGILPANKLLWAGIFCGFMGFVCIFWSASLAHLSPTLVWLAIACCFAFVAYTLPPFKLNYRGGGELLEMAGTGILLPLIMAYLQAGAFPETAYLHLFVPFSLLSLSSAVASGFSDEESDRKGGKTTFVTLAGNRRGRIVVEMLVLTAFLFLWSGLLATDLQLFHWLEILPISILSASYFRQLRSISPQAVTNAFGPQGMYKLLLHKIIWFTGLYFSLVLLVRLMVE